MNREQKRKMIKKARNDGMSKKSAETFVEIMSGTGSHTESQNITDGQKVMLNIESIKARKHYERMSDAYKEFIESSNEKVYTAKVEPVRKNLITLEEDTRWLFWSGDLIKVENSTEIEEINTSINVQCGRSIEERADNSVMHGIFKYQAGGENVDQTTAG